MFGTRLVVAAAVLTGFAAGSVAHADEPEGLVSRWAAEGDTTDALARNNGSSVGGVTYATGAVGQGFDFTGANYVEVANPTFDDHVKAFTVMAWIRIDSYGNSPSVVNHRTNANVSGFSLEQRFGAPGTMTFGVNQSGQFDDYPQVFASGWNAGTLYHIAATFDSRTGTMTLYRDGRAVAGRADLPRTPMATAPNPQFQIGHNIRATAEFWDGLVDDVRFYDRALTPSEIASFVPPTQLVAHWTFDEESGPTAHDRLGSYDGTLSGGAAFTAGGIAGNCVSLDRAMNSFVNMGTNVPAFTSGDFSVVVWVKTSATEIDTLALSRHEAFVSNGYIVPVGPTGGGGAAGKATFYASDPQVAQAPVSTTTVNDGAWHQIIGVYRAGGTHSVYVDGAPAEATTASSPIVDRGAFFLIGGVKSNGQPESRFTGLIDDVQLYATALTDGQIDYLFAHPGRPAPAAVYDLRLDWTDAVNPNGTWTYREGANALPQTPAWGTQGFLGTQPAWARSAPGAGNTFLPGWFRSGALTDLSYDWLSGDIVVHTTDGTNGVGNGNANVIWTSPFTGTVDISGSVWRGRSIGRGNDWFVYRNGTLLSQGTLADGDGHGRTNPFQLGTGSGGAAALRDVDVAVGDTLRLEFAKTSNFGDFVGANFTVSVAEPTEQRVVTYFLPTRVKATLKGAGKDSLIASGIFDDGGAAIDFTQPVTVELGGYSKTFTLTGNATGSLQKYKDAQFTMTVKPKQKGSSRGKFTLKVSKETLGGMIDPNGTLDVHFSAAGLPDAQARIKLTSGAYGLGLKRGTLFAPAFFPSKVKISANSTKPDRIALTAGFASGEATPDALGPVRIAIGPQFTRTLRGESFTRKGDGFSYSERVGSTSLSVKVDFLRGTVTVKAKGFEVGALDAASADITFDGGTDALPAKARVRFASSGVVRTY